MTSGGKALLAQLEPGAAAKLYGIGSARPAMAADDWDRLVAELKLVRRRGYATNPEGTEAGLHALGRATRDERAEAVAAPSIAMPSDRYSRRRVPVLVGDLPAAAEATGRGEIR
jgi:IclR family transcriptional regulator, acetate operon repressor